MPARRQFCILLTALLTALAAGYGLIIYLTSVGNNWWLLDVFNNVRIWGMDDAYRFFLTSQAFSRSQYFNWSYLLPLQPLLDGGLSAISGHNIVIMRAVHGGLYLLALGVFGRCVSGWLHSARLGLLSVLLLGIIPACLFVALSFYAESYMQVLTIAIIWAFLTRRDNWLCGLVAVAVLLRPEALFLVLSMGLYFVQRRDWRRAVAVFIPGFIYLLVVLATCGWGNFVDWRTHFSVVQRLNVKHFELFTNAFNIVHVWTGWVLVPAAVGLCSRRVWRLWPLLLAAALWGALWVYNILVGYGTFEPRYFASITPVVVLLWAAGLAQGGAWLSAFWRPVWRTAAAGLLMVTTLGVFAFQQVSINFYVTSLFSADPLPLSIIKTTTPRLGGRAFVPYKQALFKTLYKAASPINAQRVQTLMIASKFTWIFYFLEADRLAADVRVAFAPTNSAAPLYRWPTHVFAMFGSGARYGYYDFQPYQPDLKSAVYIGRFERVRPDRLFADVPLYLLSYQRHN